MVLDVGKDEEAEKQQILDPIYDNFLSFKKGVLERISACGFLYRALSSYSKRYARAQVAATLQIWTRK